MAKNKKTPIKSNNKAKPVAKAPAKAKKEAKPAAKPSKKPIAKAKEVKPAKVVKPTKPVKPEVKAKEVTPKAKAKEAIKETKVAKAAEESVEVAEKTAKGPAKSKSKTKAKKTDKKQDEFEDDLLDDDFGDSEIAEYEDDLKAVEDEDEDINEEISEDDELEARDTEVYLTDSEGRRLCRVRDCDQVANVEAYCRHHYLLLWKRIQVRKNILQDGKLEKYIDDLTSRYPDKFLEMIKKDMKSEKDFLGAIQELEIDESALGEMDDSAEDDAQSFADEIRGVADAPVIDDDGDY